MFKGKRAVILMLLTGIIAVGSCGSPRSDREASPGGEISLAGPWKISLADNAASARPDHDDSSWDEIRLPGSLLGFARKKGSGIRGVLWLRKTVRVPAEREGLPMGLILGRIANADETWFNGVKVGSTGSFPPDEFSMWNHPRHYSVPSRLIRYGGSNVIAVRVSYNVYAEVIGKLALADYAAWAADRRGGEFGLITHSYLIIAIAVLLLILFLFFFIARPGDQEYLFYCLQIFFGFFIVFDLCTYWDVFPSFYFRLQTVAISWVAINVAHIIFLHRIYQIRRKRVEIALWLYLSVWTVLVFFLAEKSPLLYGIILISLCTVLGLYHISCHLYALMKKRPYARLFSFFGITVICCAMHDSFVYLSKFSGTPLSLLGYSFDRMIFHYGAFSLFVGTALALVYRFLRLTEEVGLLNSVLETYIIENALLEKQILDKNEPGARRMITENTEEKIRRVIDYINDNYVHDISREGLAASVGIHPDNLSKLFNAYKNMRIGDYINELRIQDAAARLLSSEESVTDIAFAVGFESTRTFNRAFAKYMNTTPEKYRKRPDQETH